MADKTSNTLNNQRIQSGTLSADCRVVETQTDVVGITFEYSIASFKLEFSIWGDNIFRFPGSDWRKLVAPNDSSQLTFGDESTEITNIFSMGNEVHFDVQNREGGAIEFSLPKVECKMCFEYIAMKLNGRN